MPNTSSATKALRQAERRHAGNLRLKTALRKALHSVSQATLSATVSLIDKSVKHHLLHANKAARMKSQLAKSVGIATTKRTSPIAKPTSTKTTAPHRKPAKATK